MFTSHQLRAARAILGWSARELAERAGIHITTVQRVERATGPASGNVATHEKIARALEASGIEFLNDDGRRGVVLNEQRRGPD